MAKKAQAKKAAKKSPAKATKKAAKKATKKAAPKKATKKTAAKSAPKKVVKKASKAVKKAVKKVAPKKVVKSAAKSAKKAVKSAAKATKKVVKSAAKSAKTNAKKVVKKTSAPAKKIVAKAKVVAKKVAPKKVTKTAPKKSIAAKAKDAIGNIGHSVSDFFRDAAVTAIEKIAAPKDNDASSGENSKANNESTSDNSEKEGGSDEEEEERPFVKHQTSLKPGDLAPFFEGKDQNGNDVNLASFPGKTIILYFYPKDDTPGCTATACSLRDEQQYLHERNYAVVGVSADDQQSHAKFSAKYELDFPLLADVDSKIIKAYGVWGSKQLMGKIYDGIVRTTFVISPNGIIQEVINNVDTQNHAQQILELEQSR